MTGIRLVKTQDIAAILDIYSYYIEETVISFEEEVPTLDEFTHRVETISQHLPWLVYLSEDEVLGYAYASKHRERSAYRWSVDVSVYLKNNSHGKGIGTQLYKVLLHLLIYLGYYNAYAGISLPNEKSVRIHEKFGFLPVGIYKKVGFKFNQWTDVGWWYLDLMDKSDKPERPLSISEIPEQEIKSLIDKSV